MADLPAWEELINGSFCPLCAPREKYTEFIYFVGTLSISSLYLSRNQAYLGSVALIYDGGHATGIGQLNRQQWAAYSEDIQRTEKALRHAFDPDHLNIECLGNSVPHLHFHFIPRYRSDPRWRHPIWMTERSDMPVTTLNDQEYARLAEKINASLEADAIPESGSRFRKSAD